MVFRKLFGDSISTKTIQDGGKTRADYGKSTTESSVSIFDRVVQNKHIVFDYIIVVYEAVLLKQRQKLLETKSHSPKPERKAKHKINLLLIIVGHRSVAAPSVSFRLKSCCCYSGVFVGSDIYSTSIIAGWRNQLYFEQ